MSALGAWTPISLAVTFLAFVTWSVPRMQVHLAAIVAAEVDPSAAGAVVTVDRLSAVYATLQLFTLNAPVIEAVPTPLWLAWARVLAPSISVVSIIVALSRLLRTFLRGWFVTFNKDHEVVCLDEERALQWARDLPVHGRRRTILIVPRVSTDGGQQLQQLGVRPLVVPFPDPARGPFANAVSRASVVTVDLGDDLRTLAFALAAREVGQRRPRRAVSGRIDAHVASSALESAVERMDPLDAAGEHLTRVNVTSRDRRLQRSMRIDELQRRALRGPLRVAVVGGGPHTGALIDAIVSVLEPGEEGHVTLLLPPGATVPTLPEGLSVDVRADVPPERMASLVHDLRRELSDDGSRAGLGSPVLVHLPDAMQSVLVVAGLTHTLDLRVALVPPSGVAAERSMLEELLNPGVGAASLRIVGVADVRTIAHLDGLGRTRAVAEAMADAIDGWPSIAVCGEHPAKALLRMLERERTPGGAVSDDVVEQVLVALERGGLSLRLRQKDERVRSHRAMRHVVDRLAKDLGLRDLIGLEVARSREGLLDRAALAHLVMRLDRIVVDGCGLVLVENDAAPRPTWLDDSALERMGRSIHERYRASLAPEDREGPANVPWETLGEVYRESNIAQARRIPLKVAALGLDLADASTGPVGDWPDGLAPSERQIEALAEFEHRLWSEYLLSRGWVYGERSHDHHPDLQAYENLSDATKQKDRNTIIEMPGVLAAAELRLVEPGRDPDPS